jgi:hypothetical protein
MTVTGIFAAQVRSVTLDTWLPDQVAFMERTGNAVANSFWEAKLGQTRKPDHDAPELQAFIRRKVCASAYKGTFLDMSLLFTSLNRAAYVSMPLYLSLQK